MCRTTVVKKCHWISFETSVKRVFIKFPPFSDGQRAICTKIPLNFFSCSKKVFEYSKIQQWEIQQWTWPLIYGWYLSQVWSKNIIFACFTFTQHFIYYSMWPVFIRIYIIVAITMNMDRFLVFGEQIVSESHAQICGLNNPTSSR